MEKISRVRHGQAWTVQGWLTSPEYGHRGGELQNFAWTSLGSTGIGDFLGTGTLG